MKSQTPLPELPDFSLVVGGPLYQLWRRLFLAGPALELLARRMIGIPSVAWLPFLYDLEVHARYLVAIPILLMAEIVVHQRIRVVVRQFVDTGIITSETLP